MEAVDLHADAWKGIRNSYETGRLAHAYLVVGSPRGHSLQFAESILKLLYCQSAEKPCNHCTNCNLIDSHKHVDTLWLEPQSKARQIKADEVRGLVHRMTQTSFEGGWKAGVLISAECMNVSSANILLKTLEEPPPKTILLLVTDSPQSLLPTIVSRCQKIVLSNGKASAVATDWQEPLMEVVRELPPGGGLDAAKLAGRLKSILDAVKTQIADVVDEELGNSNEALDESKLKDVRNARTSARLKEVETEVFRIMLDWHRDILMLVSKADVEHLVFIDEQDVLAGQAVRHTQASALQAIRVVEGMARRLDRNIPAMQIFDEAFRKLVKRS